MFACLILSTEIFYSIPYVIYRKMHHSSHQTATQVGTCVNLFTKNDKL